jgi:ribosomal protein L37AE/L43A
MEGFAKYSNLVIKLNNTSMRENCALCGFSDKANIGPAIFVEGTWNFVCDGCAQRVAPELYEIVCDWQRAEEQRLKILSKVDTERNPFENEPPQSDHTCECNQRMPWRDNTMGAFYCLHCGGQVAKPAKKGGLSFITDAPFYNEDSNDDGLDLDVWGVAIQW